MMGETCALFSNDPTTGFALGTLSEARGHATTIVHVATHGYALSPTTTQSVCRIFRPNANPELPGDLTYSVWVLRCHRYYTTDFSTVPDEEPCPPGHFRNSSFPFDKGNYCTTDLCRFYTKVVIGSEQGMT